MKVIFISLLIIRTIQAHPNDSLVNAFYSAQLDQTKIEIAYKLANEFYKTDKDSSNYYIDYILTRLANYRDDTIRGYTLKLKGNIYFIAGDKNKAHEFYLEALDVFKSAKEYKGIDEVLNNLGLIAIKNKKYDEALNYLNESIDNALKWDNRLSVAKTMHNIGWIYENQAMYGNALEYYLKALNIKREFNDSNTVSHTLNNIGNIYKEFSEFEKSILYYRQSLNIALEANDTTDIALRYYNLGRVYSSMNNYDTAMIHYLNALDLYKKLDNQAKTATIYNSIGNLYAKWRKDNEAIKFYKEAIKLTSNNAIKADYHNNLATSYEQINNLDKARIHYEKAIKLNDYTNQPKKQLKLQSNFAGFLLKTKNYRSSKEYFKEALKNAELLGIDSEIANVKQIFSDLFYEKNQYKKSLDLLLEAKAVADTTDNVHLMREIYNRLYLTYKAMNNRDKALTAYEKFVQLNDSIYKNKSIERSIEFEKKYELKKKEQEILYLSSQAKLERLESTAKDITIENVTRTRNLLIFAATLTLLLMMIILYALMSKRKANKKLKQYNAEILEQQEEIRTQRDEIEAQVNQLDKQNHILEQQKVAITDSIKYARYIQKGIFPEHKLFNYFFDQFFVVYMPKDIVSGDFYFAEETKDNLFFAAVDCTGHGVPGAFMSLLGYNSLRIAIREHALTEPKDILEFTDEQIKEILHSSGEIGDNGMDAILVRLNKKTNSICYAGANRPLIIFREGILNELKSNKRSIGRNLPVLQKPFEQKCWDLHKGDTLYMFSDGYIDQFGGPKNQKFKSAQFKNKLHEIQNMDLSIQEKILIRTFENWKGKNEQIDDLMVLGFRI